MTRTIITLVCLIGAVALFFMYTKPTYDGLQATKTKIGAYDQALDKAAELQRLKQSLLSRYNAFSAEDVDRLHKLLPDHVDNVRLVLDLDTLASKKGLALQNVVISGGASEVEKAPGSVAAIAPTRRTFDSLTLRFSTSGTYPRFVDFISDLEKSLRIVDVVNLGIKADTANSGVEPVYRYDILLRTYWLK